MKINKTYLRTLLAGLVVFLVAAIIFSCASKPVENTHTIENRIENRTDSVKETKINNAILDTLKVTIAPVKTSKPECDSITQAALNQALEQLNSRKQSGDNEAGVYYDKLKRQLVMWQKVNATLNEKLAVKQKEISIKGDKQIVKIPVKFIPFWIKVLAWIGFATLCFVAWRIARIFI